MKYELASLLPSLEDVGNLLTPLAERFACDEYIELQCLFGDELFDRLRKIAKTALDSAGRRRELRMPATDYSKRSYRLAGREALLAADPFISSFYRDPQLLQILHAITAESITTVPYLPEEFIAARYEEAGDTHGWHWDDYAYALIWILEAPNAAHGGTLEFVRNVAWDKSQPRVAHHLHHGHIQQRHPARGTVYLLRTDTTLHRVTPLAQAGLREILCLSYAAPSDFARTITHETIEALL